MRKLLIACLLLCLSLAAMGQDDASRSASADVRYLMPDFTDGMIFFHSGAPAQGKLNICAEDNTLRFIDKSGVEMAAANEDNIYKVRIDTVLFLRSGGLYYRLYKVTSDCGIALKRDVRLARTGKQGAFGTTSQTSSIRESGNIYADGVSYDIEKNKDAAYEAVETLYLYKGDEVLVFNKRNLRRAFPESKDAIDAYFKGGGAVPATVPEALALMNSFKYE